MLKRKKLLALTLTALVSMGVLAGCGQKNQEAKAEETGSGEKVVNVYSSRHYDIDKQLFKDFESDTGIKVNLVKYKVYALSGFLAALAGVVSLSRINSGVPNTGTGFELDVVTAVVLGGVSVNGGVGKLSGVIIGCLIIGILSNGMILLNIGEYYQMVVKGVVLLVAVGIDNYTKNNLL